MEQTRTASYGIMNQPEHDLRRWVRMKCVVVERAVRSTQRESHHRGPGTACREQEVVPYCWTVCGGGERNLGDDWLM